VQQSTEKQYELKIIMQKFLELSKNLVNLVNLVKLSGTPIAMIQI